LLKIRKEVDIMVTANEIIKVAKKYVGYLEKESNKNLENMKANAGDNNYTIFAKKFNDLTGINNQGSAWCDMFVDTCFAEAFGKEKANKLLGGYSAYTPTSAQYFKNMKQWYTTNPKVGDVIFFKNSERICHTGLVVGVTDSIVHTIEGNTSAGKEVIPNGGAVCEKSYVINNSRIAGYGRPAYDKDGNKETKHVEKKETKTVNKYTKPTSIVKRDDKGESVKWVQNQLNKKGYKIIINGDFGLSTYNAVREFQKKHNLLVDGIVGEKTTKELSK
jgi:hypothetical protein